MKLLYSDESNLQPRNGDFFVYGGLSIPDSKALWLSNKIDEIRHNAEIPNDFILKFNPGPAGMSHSDFIRIKQEVISASIEADCALHISVILHDIATSVDEARRNEINRICYHFNCMLKREGETGLVLIDRFEDSQIDAHLREKFSIGLTGMPYSPYLKLDRILGFHYSAIGQSNFPSIMDILIGTLRFCINDHTRHPENPSSSSKVMLEELSPLFPRDLHDKIPELYFFLSPKNIKVPQFKERYESLCMFLLDNGMCPSQHITDQREY